MRKNNLWMGVLFTTIAVFLLVFAFNVIACELLWREYSPHPAIESIYRLTTTAIPILGLPAIVVLIITIVQVLRGKFP